MSEIMVEVSNVSVKFHLSRERIDSIKEYIIKKLKTRLSMMSLWRFRMSALLWKRRVCCADRFKWLWEKYTFKNSCWCFKAV